jgi:putative heme-binding domain-containing protein
VVNRRLARPGGKDRGRIWRIVRGDAPRTPRPRLGAASTAELVDALRRPDAWWRETAARLLYQRRERSAAPALEAMALDGPSPAARTAALWALRGLGALRPEIAERALADPSPRVREQGVRLASGLEALLTVLDDPDARVRFELAGALGDVEASRATAALAKLAARDGEDPWARAQILSSAAAPPGRALELLRAAPPGSEIARQLALMIGARDGGRPEVFALAGERAEVLSGLADGLRRSGRALPAELLENAATAAGDEDAPVERRADAARALASAPFERAERALAPLLEPGMPEPLRAAAARTLASFREPGAGARLLASWRGVPAAARGEALSWFRAPERQAALLDALDDGRVARGELPFDLRRALLGGGERARKLLGEGPSSDRRKVIASYLGVLDAKGDAARGREVYRKTCALCHTAAGEGRETGPDLSTVRTRSPEELLIAILDPNREVNPAFLRVKLRTRAGDVLEGIVASESSAGLTLKRAEGEPVTLLRADIEKLAPTTFSLMPEGLEAAVDVDQMADLIEFIRGLGT